MLCLLQQPVRLLTSFSPDSLRRRPDLPGGAGASILRTNRSGQTETE